MGHIPGRHMRRGGWTRLGSQRCWTEQGILHSSCKMWQFNVRKRRSKELSECFHNHCIKHQMDGHGSSSIPVSHRASWCQSTPLSPHFLWYESTSWLLTSLIFFHYNMSALKGRGWAHDEPYTLSLWSSGSIEQESSPYQCRNPSSGLIYTRFD